MTASSMVLVMVEAKVPLLALVMASWMAVEMALQMELQMASVMASSLAELKVVEESVRMLERQLHQLV